MNRNLLRCHSQTTVCCKHFITFTTIIQSLKQSHKVSEIVLILGMWRHVNNEVSQAVEPLHGKTIKARSEPHPFKWHIPTNTLMDNLLGT